MKINDIIRKPDKKNRYWVGILRNDSTDYYYFDTFSEACKLYVKKDKRTLNKALGVQNRITNHQFTLRSYMWEDKN